MARPPIFERIFENRTFQTSEIVTVIVVSVLLALGLTWTSISIVHPGKNLQSPAIQEELPRQEKEAVKKPLPRNSDQEYPANVDENHQKKIPEYTNSVDRSQWVYLPFIIGLLAISGGIALGILLARINGY